MTRLITLALLTASGFALARESTGCQSDDDEASRSRAEQTIVLLRRMVEDSDPASRVEELGTAQSRELLATARDTAEQAQHAYEAGCYAAAARLASEGLGSASAAFRAGAGKKTGTRKEYDALRSRAVGLLDSMAGYSPEEAGVGEVDMIGMRRQVASAEALALRGDYDGASHLLRPVADRLERRVLDIFDKKTLVYTREFASPAEEYAYLIEQCRGYKLLLSQSGSSQPAVADHLGRADAHHADAEEQANRENWPAAIEHIQRAVAEYDRAVKAARMY